MKKYGIMINNMTNGRILLILMLACMGMGVSAQQYFKFGTSAGADGRELLVDSKGFLLGGERLLPVMGEIHFSRVPETEWRHELLKMKAGGVTVVATYVFWNHHNDRKDVWDWNGCKNLRRFILACKDLGMPLVLRIGPFCHGEVYQGGFPVWVVDRCQKENIRMRSADAGWLEMVRDLYEHIFTQAEGLLWKDGGPVIGVQLENECRGPWPYMLALKDMAVEIGYDVPFFTRTGWPAFSGNPVCGEILPLYGDYADGFWDRELTDMPGEYKQAFEMREAKVSATIATEQFSKDELRMGDEDGGSDGPGLSYPYFTCELGGGMMTSYHRRINIFDRDALALAVCKVGSGSNLPGYYMYHGGTNPDNPDHNMAEMQSSPVTNYNDLPHKSYDFQSPLAEVGQVNESFHLTRLFHQFLADWGAQIAEEKADLRSSHLAWRGGFKFWNDYVRIANPEGKTYWQMYGVDGVDSVSAMPFCKTSDCIYYVRIPGVKAKVYGNHSGKQIRILTYEEARRCFKIGGRLVKSRHEGVLFEEDGKIWEEYWKKTGELHVRRSAEGKMVEREWKMGRNNVVEQPFDDDFLTAPTWEISPSQLDKNIFSVREKKYLRISYQGDVARVYADGKLVADNFWNGKPFYVRASDLAGKKVEIKILPLGKKYPLYLQKAERQVLDKAEGDMLLGLGKVEVVSRFLTE